MALHCRKPAGAWSTPEYINRKEYGLVLVRRGGFTRRVEGIESYVDPTSAYFEPPCTEVAIGHEVDGGDDCTVIALSEEEVVQLTGDGLVPNKLIFTTPDIDVGHRALIARSRHGIDDFELQERLTVLLGALAEVAQPGKLTTRRAQTQAAHHRIVDHVRQAIAADPAYVELGRLAAELGYSRFHVSRIFSRMTGSTLTRYRNRIRVTAALDRLAGGEPNLARLAADLGFVDQSHMVRVIRGSLGEHPSGLRRWFLESCPAPLARPV